MGRRLGLTLGALLAGALGLAPASALAATASAEYRVTFTATWSAATHPTSFPPGAHFSPMVAATHNDQVSFWQLGGLASPGIEDMAELGATSPLSDEIDTAILAGDAGTRVFGGVFFSPGEDEVTLTLTQTHSLLTLVSMVAPSPDWFVGVSGVELLSPGPEGDWIGETVIALYAHDAGTDDGVSYNSPDDDSVPAEVVSLISASPFDGGVPLGSLTITRTDTAQVAAPALSIWGAVVTSGAVWVLLYRRRGPAR